MFGVHIFSLDEGANLSMPGKKTKILIQFNFIRFTWKVGVQGRIATPFSYTQISKYASYSITECVQCVHILLLQHKLCTTAKKTPKILTRSHLITMEGWGAAMGYSTYFHCTTSFSINNYYICYRMCWCIWFRWSIKWRNKYYIYMYSTMDCFEL